MCIKGIPNFSLWGMNWSSKIQNTAKCYVIRYDSYRYGKVLQFRHWSVTKAPSDECLVSPFHALSRQWTERETIQGFDQMRMWTQWLIGPLSSGRRLSRLLSPSVLSQYLIVSCHPSRLPTLQWRLFLVDVTPFWSLITFLSHFFTYFPTTSSHRGSIDCFGLFFRSIELFSRFSFFSWDILLNYTLAPWMLN